ncbi:unnamed protein product [Agarophyton chilense]
MSVSMLLNAANAVTAAERCRAIDPRSGRIPITFLLARCDDLDDHTRRELSHLASHSPSLSLERRSCDAHPSIPEPPLPSPSHLTEQQALDDIERTANANAKRTNSGSSGSSGSGSTSTTLTNSAIRKATGSAPGSSSQSTSTSTGSGAPRRRRRWKQWEDELLQRVVAEHGATKWNNVARHFPGRNGRQVRLRWMNHLQPSLEKRAWTVQEDTVLMDAHRQLGNKWALIAMRLCGRTDNSVKNRYKSIVRRAVRDANARDANARK